MLNLSNKAIRFDKRGSLGARFVPLKHWRTRCWTWIGCPSSQSRLPEPSADWSVSRSGTGAAQGVLNSNYLLAATSRTPKPQSRQSFRRYTQNTRLAFLPRYTGTQVRENSIWNALFERTIMRITSRPARSPTLCLNSLAFGLAPPHLARCLQRFS